jgi:hypothetical protein
MSTFHRIIGFCVGNLLTRMMRKEYSFEKFKMCLLEKNAKECWKAKLKRITVYALLL